MHFLGKLLFIFLLLIITSQILYYKVCRKTKIKVLLENLYFDICFIVKHKCYAFIFMDIALSTNNAQQELSPSSSTSGFSLRALINNSIASLVKFYVLCVLIGFDTFHTFHYTCFQVRHTSR